MRLPGRRQGKLLRPRQGEGARGNGGPPAAAVDNATRRTAAWASSVADETAGDRQGEVDGRDGRGPRDAKEGLARCLTQHRLSQHLNQLHRQL